MDWSRIILFIAGLSAGYGIAAQVNWIRNAAIIHAILLLVISRYLEKRKEA